MSKKSDHKHDYEVQENKDDPWFTHKLVCKICGKIGNRFVVAQ